MSTRKFSTAGSDCTTQTTRQRTLSKIHHERENGKSTHVDEGKVCLYLLFILFLFSHFCLLLILI